LTAFLPAETDEYRQKPWLQYSVQRAKLVSSTSHQGTLEELPAEPGTAQVPRALAGKKRSGGSAYWIMERHTQTSQYNDLRLCEENKRWWCGVHGLLSKTAKSDY